jgi:drug/metabolite transporter, DME family
MQKSPSFQPSGIWLVTIAAATWGTIGVVTQAIYNTDTTTSLFLNLARMLIATPVLLVACWRILGKEMFSIQRRDFLLMALTGTLLATSQAAYFAAIRSAGVTVTTLLAISLAPLVVAGLSVVLKFEKLSQRMIVALVSALIGSALLIGVHVPENIHADLLLGSLLSVVAAATYAGVVICGRFLARGYHPLQVSTVTFGTGAFVLTVINLAVGIVTVHTTQGWLLVLYLGLVPTALAYWLFQKGLRSVTATAASIVSLLEPTVAALLAWVLFGETLPATGIIGAALLILSIFLLSR